MKNPLPKELVVHPESPSTIVDGAELAEEGSEYVHTFADACGSEKEARAREIVHRWNAHNKLLLACESVKNSLILDSGCAGTRELQIKVLEEALAGAKWD